MLTEVIRSFSQSFPSKFHAIHHSPPFWRRDRVSSIVNDKKYVDAALKSLH